MCTMCLSCQTYAILDQPFQGAALNWYLCGNIQTWDLCEVTLLLELSCQDDYFSQQVDALKSACSAS